MSKREFYDSIINFRTTVDTSLEDQDEPFSHITKSFDNSNFLNKINNQ